MTIDPNPYAAPQVVEPTSKAVKKVKQALFLFAYSGIVMPLIVRWMVDAVGTALAGNPESMETAMRAAGAIAICMLAGFICYSGTAIVASITVIAIQQPRWWGIVALIANVLVLLLYC